MPRRAGQAAHFDVVVGDYTLRCVPDGLPIAFNEYRRHAALAETFDLQGEGLCCVTVRRAVDVWPFLVVGQSFHPAGSGFEPGLVLVQETGVLFLGAGTRLLAYDLRTPRRLWEDSTEVGFLGWERHGDVVLMAAELELAAWTTAGEKLWTTFVEPPWHHVVKGESIRLDVMGEVELFPLRTGRR